MYVIRDQRGGAAPDLSFGVIVFDPVSVALILDRAPPVFVVEHPVNGAEQARLEVVRRLEAEFTTEGDLGGVKVDKIIPDMSDFLKVLDPGNPNADENGYVAMPNVNLPVEMMNLNLATRMYKANIAVLKRYQQILEATLELLR